ncbi:hypothetical protein GE061_018543 [Apolygus lucorum]|uniref:Nucleoprotein n=1 Tax=Apolygus lucorum TaxID=248454 RepID=A0A8S9XE71_APOLU|nr:hypothetical protein GE061_018543 [Apolygus lucorum]
MSALKRQQVHLQKLGPAESGELSVSGIRPTSLQMHTLAKRMTIFGITPKEAMEEYGGQGFDFKQLEVAFTEICTDYLSDYQLETAYKSLEFCCRMIYEVGPESRRVKKKTGHKVWEFVFCYKNEPGTSSAEAKATVQKKVLYVSTFKSDNATAVVEQADDYLYINVKQAGMLAVRVFSRVAQLGVRQNPKVYLLTPLAAAVFTKDQISTLCAHVGWEIEDGIKYINNSCQSGSQYFSENDMKMEIAIVAAVNAVKGLCDHTLRDSIIAKTIKQCVHNKHHFSMPLMLRIAEFASGGLPEGFDPEKILRDFEGVKINRRAAIKGAAETAITIGTEDTSIAFKGTLDDYLKNMEDIYTKHSLSYLNATDQGMKRQILDTAKSFGVDLDESMDANKERLRVLYNKSHPRTIPRI